MTSKLLSGVMFRNLKRLADKYLLPKNATSVKIVRIRSIKNADCRDYRHPFQWQFFSGNFSKLPDVQNREIFGSICL
jgi:hypothetical protein